MCGNPICRLHSKKTVRSVKAWQKYLPPVYEGVGADADRLFDMICARNWFCGNQNANIPVEESRAAFRALKEILTLPPKQREEGRE